MSRRDTYGFPSALTDPLIVDQLGTGVTLMLGRDAPPFENIAHGQKFVDIAAAHWWFKNGRTLVCLAREANWITERPATGETIFNSFTSRTPAHAADEIYRFAFRNPRVGRVAMRS